MAMAGQNRVWVGLRKNGARGAIKFGSDIPERRSRQIQGDADASVRRFCRLHDGGRRKRHSTLSALSVDESDDRGPSKEGKASAMLRGVCERRGGLPEGGRRRAGG